MERKWTRRISGCFKIFRTGRQVDTRASGNTYAGVEQRNLKKTDRQRNGTDNKTQWVAVDDVGCCMTAGYRKNGKGNIFGIQIFFYFFKTRFSKVTKVIFSLKYLTLNWFFFLLSWQQTPLFPLSVPLPLRVLPALQVASCLWETKACLPAF